MHHFTDQLLIPGANAQHSVALCSLEHLLHKFKGAKSTMEYMRSEAIRSPSCCHNCCVRLLSYKRCIVSAASKLVLRANKHTVGNHVNTTMIRE